MMFKDYLEIEDLAKLLQPKRRSMLYGEWLGPTEDELKLQGLAEQYHSRCDAFDDAVCTGISPRTGEAMPIDGGELGLVNKNARQVREDIMRQGYAMEFIEKDVEEAIRNYAR
jgi:hypothetical protein